MAELYRTKSLCIRVTDEERDLIRQKMKQAEMRNLRAYITKMCIDGYVIRLDLSEVHTMVSLLRNATNNLNQIARRVNETSRLYAQDIMDLQTGYDKLWEQSGRVLEQLAKMRR